MLMKVLMLAIVGAIMINAASSGYSAWVASNNHHASCSRSDLVLNTLHDVVVEAFTPATGQTLTSGQVTAIQTVESKIFARIDQARC